MIHDASEIPNAELVRALSAPQPSARLKAALRAGSDPRAGYVDLLIARCAVEPDFFVRDMLTWALVRHDAALTVSRPVAQLVSEVSQARSQSLHTLSKIGDPSTWSFITRDLLTDIDAEVARAAWRTAAALVPMGEESALAETLATQFGRGDRDVQLSLSRAFATLGTAVFAVVERAANSSDEIVRAHALATVTVMRDPDAGFDSAIAEAKRTVALLGAPLIDE